MLQEGIYDAFEEAVTKKVGELKSGGGLDPSTTLGPLIGHAAVDRVRPRHPLARCMLRGKLPEMAGSVAMLRNECAPQQATACIMPSLAHAMSRAGLLANSYVLLSMRRWRHMWRTLSPRAPRSPSEERSLTCQSPTTRCVRERETLHLLHFPRDALKLLQSRA